MDRDDGTLPDATVCLDEAACGLVLTGADGTILRANQTFCDWIGRSADELLGKRRFQDLLTMGGRIFHQTQWAPLLQIQGSVAEVKLDLLAAGGKTLPMVLNAVRRERHGGGFVHHLALFVARDRDLYERELLASRQQAVELAQQQRVVQEALSASQVELKGERERAVDRALFAEQMVGIVSHDLRTPLSAIKMSTYLLGRAPAGDAAKLAQAIGRINKATDRALRLIVDLLDFTAARIGSGLSIRRKPIDLHAVVAEAIDELSVAYPGRPIEHRRLGDGDCSGDADRLTQALGNLVANAMAYGVPDQRVRVSSSTEGASFMLEVHNGGTPIPPEVLPVLFEPGQRGTTAPNPERSIGLGLFIVREIARAHGGEATVTSTAADGTRFTIVCPR